jgi:hypothetical protein
MSVLGILVAIVATLAAALWQVALLIYNSQSPSGAFGALLDRLFETTGMLRLSAATSTVDCVAVGTNSTVLAVGRRIKNAVTNTYWVSTEAATIVTLGAWAGSTAYAKGALRTNDTGKIYYCTVAGTSAGAGGPTGTGTAITDGSCTWRYIAAGAAAVVVPFASEETGEIVGAAGNLTSIETPQGGWTSVVNPLDAAQGRDIETDAAFRIRQRASLRSTGNAALDAIISDISKVDGVERVVCFVNNTDATDGDGVPPHAVEVLVSGGADQDILDALLATVAAGIQTHGTESGTATDTEGNVHALEFSRPTAVPIYYVIDIEVDGDFPSDGDAQVKQAIVDFHDGLEVGGVVFSYGLLDIGDDVIRNDLFAPIKQVSGIPRVDNIKLGTAPAPAGTADLTITSRQIAESDTSRIAVNHV